MTINKTQFQAARRLPQEIRKLKQEARAFKNPQPLGADVLDVQAALTDAQIAASSGAATVAAGSQITFSITATPFSSILTLWNFLSSLYIDTPASAGSLYGGVNNTLTSGQKNLTREDWWDWAESSDSSNVRVFKVRIKNNDSISHTYYLFWNTYFPSLSAGA